MVPDPALQICGLGAIPCIMPSELLPHTMRWQKQTNVWYHGEKLKIVPIMTTQLLEGALITTVNLQDALKMLEQTSRTFYIPISRLAPRLKEAVTAAYLCMRAIDEIEDHSELSDEAKIRLLSELSAAFRSTDVLQAIHTCLFSYRTILPDVTLRLREWVDLCPPSVAPSVNRYIAMMAEQMAEWVQSGWIIRTEEDLDRYTYSVAGMVGEMLSELWQWYDDTKSDPVKAVAFGRGLQAVNIIRNRDEDMTRGVDFFPDGWGLEEMLQYTRRNLQAADAYIAELKQGPAWEFCVVPLALAHATVNVIAAGGSKLTRDNVLDIVGRVTG